MPLEFSEKYLVRPPPDHPQIEKNNNSLKALKQLSDLEIQELLPPLHIIFFSTEIPSVFELLAYDLLRGY